MKIKPYAKALVIAVALSTTLGGCVAAIVGGAAVGGMSALDRRTTGAQTDDNVMELRIQNNALIYLEKNNSVKGFTPKVSVVSYNHEVLLMGQVATPEDKVQVERIARSEQAARAVYNYIDIAPQARTFGNITNDSAITSKVRTTLLNMHGVYPGHVKVVTYAGVTYVMGLLTPTEQAIVTNKVSTTAGVQKVVTLYEHTVNK